MNEIAKRQRSTNFSNEEKINCLSVIRKYKHIIENKETGTRTWKEKENAWKEIAREFNSCSTIYRSVETLKRFYNNKKKETRKYAAQQKLLLTRTGGGQVIKLPDDPIFNLTMDIINKKTVFGLSNTYDDDDGRHDVHEFPISNDEFRTLEIVSSKVNTPTTSTRAERSNTEKDYEPKGHAVKLGISGNTGFKYGTPSTSRIGEYYKENDCEADEFTVDGQIDQIEVEDMETLEMSSSQAITSDLPNTQTGPEETLPEEEAQNWDGYSARNLKMPVAKALKQKNRHRNQKNTEWQSRRRPQLTNTSSIVGHYEEVARIKKEVFEVQLSLLRKQEVEAEQKIKWEKRHREIKETRETEEYELKKKILLLDIKIKEEQLIALQKANR